MRKARTEWSDIRSRTKSNLIGSPFTISPISAREQTPAQRREVFEKYWRDGGLGMLFESYCDILSDRHANDALSEFVRKKIRAQVRDPEVTRKLLPDYLLGTKRQILDEGYYKTFNCYNVTLVDLREDPIAAITPGGVRTRSGEHALDMLVFATGFDAITGALQRLNPRGRGGVTRYHLAQRRRNVVSTLTFCGMRDDCNWRQSSRSRLSDREIECP